MIRPLLHIGYFKTGTSWLQRYLFPNTTAGFVKLGSKTELTRQLVYPHALDFDSAQATRFVEPLIADAVKKDLVPVVTIERLSGNPHSGGYDSKELADRLVAVFPNGKVLIVIREQKSIILSTYKQYVRERGPCSLTDYLQPPLRGHLKIPFFDFTQFQYDRLIAYYFRLFGESNVLVLPHELFRRDPSCFVRRILRFSGIEVPTKAVLPYSSEENAGVSAFFIGLKRRINPLDARDTLNPHQFFDAPVLTYYLNKLAKKLDSAAPAAYKAKLENRMKAKVGDLVGDRYVQSNYITSQLIGFDLAEYGYDISSASNLSESSGESNSSCAVLESVRRNATLSTSN